ncbi:peptide/nickel transport system substrate-binding protein [Rhizobiales bacterium GAS113]|nr:peptide/nickel transport system substrate-binding protein [Rhizobiales bacterium GAS113]
MRAWLRAPRFSIAATALATMIMLPHPLAAAGPEFRLRLGEDPETLYNVKSFSLTVGDVLGPYLLERLVYFDESGQPRPWLAESWTISEDQQQITFKLRSGLKFSDGTDLDAAAVKFQFDQVMDKKNAAPTLPLLGPLTSVEAVDPLTVNFNFDKPFAPFISNIAQASFGFNSPSAVKKSGDQYGRHVVGSGPYMLKSWEPGTEIVLVRNPNFHQWRGDALNKGEPYADKFTLTVLSEEGVVLNALQTGELSAAPVATDVIDKLASNPKINLVIKKVVNNLLFLEFNETRAPFNDVNFRRAIGYAIDRDAAVKAAYGGYGAPELNSMASGIPGYDPQIPKQFGSPYDPVKAKAILAEGGWKKNADGLFEKDGKPARFVIKSYAGFEPISRTLAVIQSNLADVGIAVTLETSDWGTFFPGLLKGDWDMDLMRWTWTDPGILSILFRPPGHRKMLLANAAQDEGLDRCNTIMDPEKRKGCVAGNQKALLESATIVPVLSNWFVVATQANVKDYHLDFFNALIPGDMQLAQ